MAKKKKAIAPVKPAPVKAKAKAPATGKIWVCVKEKVVLPLSASVAKRLIEKGIATPAEAPENGRAYRLKKGE